MSIILAPRNNVKELPDLEYNWPW